MSMTIAQVIGRKRVLRSFGSQRTFVRRDNPCCFKIFGIEPGRIRSSQVLSKRDSVQHVLWRCFGSAHMNSAILFRYYTGNCLHDRGQFFARRRKRQFFDLFFVQVVMRASHSAA